MKGKKIAILEPDVFDILSATWVFACRDENPIITYRGLRHRLGLATSFDIEGLVRSRRDLFRIGVPETRLEDWKKTLLEGKRIPAWLKEIEDEVERNNAIKSLSRNDVFRSQFRANRDAPQSDLNEINWGLQHIDRLRKAHQEAHEKSAKSWQMWLVFAVGILNIVTTVGIALYKK